MTHLAGQILTVRLSVEVRYTILLLNISIWSCSNRCPYLLNLCLPHISDSNKFRQRFTTSMLEDMLFSYKIAKDFPVSFNVKQVTPGWCNLNRSFLGDTAHQMSGLRRGTFRENILKDCRIYVHVELHLVKLIWHWS